MLLASYVQRWGSQWEVITLYAALAFQIGTVQSLLCRAWESQALPARLDQVCAFSSLFSLAHSRYISPGWCLTLFVSTFPRTQKRRLRRQVFPGAEFSSSRILMINCKVPNFEISSIGCNNRHLPCTLTLIEMPYWKLIATTPPCYDSWNPLLPPLAAADSLEGKRSCRLTRFKILTTQVASWCTCSFWLAPYSSSPLLW